MRKELLKKYFNKIAEETNGDTTSNSEIIDWEDGNSLSMKELEEIYNNYQYVCDDIDEFIDEFELDDGYSEDYDKIVDYAKKEYGITEDYFRLNQARLIDFVPFAIKEVGE